MENNRKRRTKFQMFSLNQSIFSRFSYFYSTFHSQTHFLLEKSKRLPEKKSKIIDFSLSLSIFLLTFDCSSISQKYLSNQAQAISLSLCPNHKEYLESALCQSENPQSPFDEWGRGIHPITHKTDCG